MSSDDFTVAALTEPRWADLEQLFGRRGAVGGCWCMYWRLTGAQFEQDKGERNRAALRTLVATGQPPGILGYVAGVPVGWCSVAPREQFGRLERSRVLARVPAVEPVWSVVCFFVTRRQRGSGLSGRLLRAAVAFAAERGAGTVEGYPVEPRTEQMPGVFAWTGLAPTFRAAGFREVARRSETRPIMHYVVGAP